MTGTLTDRRRAAGRGAASVFVLGIAALLAGAAVLPGLVPGWRSVVVTSGSMEPAVSVGDIVLVREGSSDLGVGSVVLFTTSTGPITHRVVDARADGTYATKGDANPSPDSTPLRPGQVQGRARVVIPKAGLPTIWWQQQRLAPLAMALFVVAAAGVHFSTELRSWGPQRRHASRSRSRHRALPTATTVLALTVVLTATTTSTARAAFFDAESNEGSRFVAAKVDRYRLRSDGPGDRVSTYLPLSSPSAVGTTNATLFNYDTDRNADPGLTLRTSANGLAETNGNRLQWWYQQVPAGGVSFNGQTRLRFWSAAEDFSTTQGGGFVAGLYDCVIWPDVSCALLGSGSVSATPWNPSPGWRETVIDLGSINTTVSAGRYLALKVVAVGSGPSWMWLAYDTPQHPAALEVTP